MHLKFASMNIERNKQLKPFSSFGIEALAEKYVAFDNMEDLEELFETHQIINPLILGGGSNILFTKNVKGFVLKNEILGIEKVKEDSEHIYIKVGAGVNWHEFVMYCVLNNHQGVENLSLIPGTVGASPMQNIGAYGVELAQVFDELEAYNIDENEIHTFTNEECKFGYRDSVFKNIYKGEYIITQVTFKLNKKPQFNTSYGAITQQLELDGVTELSIKAISNAVIVIRQSKLPNPAEIGNAGSFFKNPTIANELANKLKTVFETIPLYPVSATHTKLAAGWLIEQCGFKGYRKNNYGVHAKQALVLVNYGNATGTEIYNLSTEILQAVKEKFGVVLEREVNVV